MALPDGVKEIYASELADADSCPACTANDGRTYDSLAAAKADYPDPRTGYVHCTADRCRGLLVYVNASEGDATVR